LVKPLVVLEVGPPARSSNQEFRFDPDNVFAKSAPEPSKRTLFRPLTATRHALSRTSSSTPTPARETVGGLAIDVRPATGCDDARTAEIDVGDHVVDRRGRAEGW
jgi:hypothetical protein